MRIAYLDHSYHRETKSTAFIPSLLQKVAEVEFYWDKGWRGGSQLPFDQICEAGFDGAVVFQSESAAEELAKRKPRFPVVYIPMWDSSACEPRTFWTRKLKGVRIVAFCRWQAERLARWGVDVKTVRFYPEVQQSASGQREGKLRGVFWWRRGHLGFRSVSRLCDEEQFASLHVHLGPDPGEVLDESELEDSPLPVTLSRWGEDASVYRQAVEAADVVFAPRWSEGIGMAALEAMAAGKAVVAPDRPTMNEYITHGVNGYLVAPGETAALDLSRAREVGARAREAMERGRQAWEAQQADLLDWMFGQRKTPVVRGAGAGDFLAEWASLSAAGIDVCGGQLRLAEIPHHIDFIVGHYFEGADGHLEERRTVEPDGVDYFTNGNTAPLLERVPVPESVFVRRGFSCPWALDAVTFAQLLRSGRVWHADRPLVQLGDTGLRNRRQRALFQAQVLSAWGVPAPVVARALKQRAERINQHAAEATLGDKTLWRKPSRWWSALRQLWPVKRILGWLGAPQEFYPFAERLLEKSRR